jgi:hypothetical protein
LRCGRYVLQHREHGDGVISLTLWYRGRRVPLNKPERSVIRRDRCGIDANPRRDPAPQSAKQGAVAAPDVEDMRPRGDVSRGLARAPGLQDRIARFDLHSSRNPVLASDASLHAQRETPRSSAAIATELGLVARAKRRNCNASERSLCRRQRRRGALVDSEQGGGMEQGHTAP